MKNKINLIVAFLFTATLFSSVPFGNYAFAKNGSFYNVKNYGAKNDGSARADKAISKAIEHAHKAGGGTIFFPAGEYLTGPIHFKSNITIHIDAGAVLKFSDNFDDYLPMVPSSWEGTDVTNFSPLFYAYEVENIAIVGRGKIDGQGKKWWDFHHKLYDKSMPRSKWQDEFARLNKDVLMPDIPEMVERGFLRPPFIQPMYSKNILIEGITIVNSPFWTINPVACENVVVHGVTIHNPKSPNTDGINPESCKYVRISDCHITVGDDCITIKSGKDRSGRARALPAENYTITNCTMLSGHGGVVIGSEMSGDVKKITISNCIFDGTDRGIRIKSMRGRGGVVEDIRVDNIVMKNIGKEIFVLDMHYGVTNAEPVSERTPQFRNIHLSNVTAEGNHAAIIRGLDEMAVENISFNNINVSSKTGFTIENARNIAFHKAQISTEKGPSIRSDKVSVIEIDGLKTLTPHAGTPIVHLINTKDVFIHGSFQFEPSDIFLKLEGKAIQNITLQNNNFKNVKETVIKDDHVVSDQLVIK